VTEFPLLDATGATRRVPIRPAPAFTRPRRPFTSRVAYAAAHVVPKPWAENVPGAPADIDWDETLAFRHHLWSWGLGVADAMDTAQRNMGLDPAATRELIRRGSAAAREVGGAIVVGVNTDHIADELITLDEVIAAYQRQLHFSEDAGTGVVLMASRHLARAARSAEDYERVYREVLSAAASPVILHWLGPAFDPELDGYFGSTDVAVAMRTVVRVIEDNVDRVAGIKVSLLDAAAEIGLRRLLPEGVAVYTGDDYNYTELIEGDAEGENPRHSNALLGAFAALAPSASAAIQALDAGDSVGYRSILRPTEALSRHIFAAPTYYYKAGIGFLSWLNGHQRAYALVGGLHAARSLVHLSEIVRLANEVGALEQPELAAERWHALLRANGVL
jgi:hypothetical protein